MNVEVLINVSFFIIAIVSLVMVIMMLRHSSELCQELCDARGYEYFSYSIGDCECAGRKPPEPVNVTVFE